MITLRCSYVAPLALLFLSQPVQADLGDLIREQVCDKDGAFAQGMNDARKGEDMNPGFASVCDRKDREAVKAGYREGYEAGLKSRDREKPLLEIVLPAKESKRTLCELSPFTDKYTAWGNSLLEAQEAVKAKCTAKHDEMFCKDFDCRD